MLKITPLHPLFAAEVVGLDLSKPLEPETIDEVRAALAKYSVLVFRDQAITDEQQISFSEHFGELETTKVGTPGAGARQSFCRTSGRTGRSKSQPGARF